jgi:hypothetical protein
MIKTKEDLERDTLSMYALIQRAMVDIEHVLAGCSPDEVSRTLNRALWDVVEVRGRLEPKEKAQWRNP